MNKPHKHAQLMLQYAQDAQETNEPWSRWEMRANNKCDWNQCVNPYMFVEDFQYRRKPRVIVINGIEVPEPMREKPEKCEDYYLVMLTGSAPRIKWRNDNTDNYYLLQGLCHLTREAAELHGKALLSFTKKEETK